MTVRRRMAPRFATRKEVLLLLHQGWNGTLKELAEKIGAKKESVRFAVRALADEGLMARVGQRDVYFSTGPGRRLIAIRADVWGPADQAEAPPVDVVASAMQTVAHLPRWLGGLA
jgi:DNA-binding IclR family transcriptional regulator